MTAEIKGPKSALQLKMLSVDGGKQRPRVRTVAEDFLGQRLETEAVLQLRIFLGDGGNQRPGVRATAENAVG